MRALSWEIVSNKWLVLYSRKYNRWLIGERIGLGQRMMGIIDVYKSVYKYKILYMMIYDMLYY